ncbi:isoprenylcysteine carboxylmethyltransferase family protein [Rhizobium mayense]|uniref:Isoprenylcysteine carboxylmethyltransferase family protein n=1 Tax=Rhizobium mayense TaxID=1312184 RepID=A0ABT7K469_9HYPH|nr:isoprenylcysteine carboxylmethyltransferase family protein [Rhizobium mayense]MDL2403387.1 isoprenylcysteine carboxylmethyltransferase family protein [Rhizobium mayense]
MPTPLIIFVIIAFVWRISTVVISTINERALKASGAREVGAANSVFLALAHLVFYIVATVEGATRTDVNFTVSEIGFVIYLVSALALISVLRSLGRLWTVKIIINERQPFVRTGLFSWVRHPNYFLNIIPELIGFALAMNAYRTLIVGLPLYCIPLVIRIRQEEAAMSEAVPGYR